MTLKPCKSDFYNIVFLEVPVMALGVALLIYLSDSPRFLFVSTSLVMVWAAIEEAKCCLYLMRTIHLTEEGMTVTIGKYSKSYSWSELVVYDYNNDTGMSLIEQINPGLLIVPQRLKKSLWHPPIDFCSSHYPLRSVFLRFESNDTMKRDGIWKGAIREGYTVPKEKILALLALHIVKIGKS